MAYQRKTKDVVCKKCGRPNRLPANQAIDGYCCLRRNDKGYACFGNFRLDKLS